MGKSVIKQPNGTYAVFDTGVNDFTVLNGDVEDVMQEFRIDAEDFAAKSIKKADAQTEDAWHGALDTVKTVHGAERLAEIEQDIKDDLIPSDCRTVWVDVEGRVIGIDWGEDSA